MRSISVQIVAAIAAFSVCDCFASSTCPLRPLGVHVEQSKGKTVLYAVASEETMGQGDLAQDLAASTAELKAKSLLAPKGNEMAILSGVVQAFSCMRESFVYVGVKLDGDNIRNANVLQRMIQESFKDNPTPGAKPGR
jgi:hypothetical protein